MTNSPKGHPEYPSIVGVLFEEVGQWYRLRGDVIPANFYALMLEDGQRIDRGRAFDLQQRNRFAPMAIDEEYAPVLASEATHWPPVGMPGLDGAPEQISRILEWPEDAPDAP